MPTLNTTSIEYGDYAYNPVTGCLGDCPYCFARTIAARFAGYDGADTDPLPDTETIVLKEPRTLTRKGKTGTAPYPCGFTPTLYEYRLNDIRSLKKAKTVLVCFNGDLFGPWVPDDWIERVFQSCLGLPGRFLFLTKYPERYDALREKGLLPKEDGFWYGTTVTDPAMPFFAEPGWNAWLSIEPIQRPFGVPSEDALQGMRDIGWCVLGAETGNRKNRAIPTARWIRPVTDVFQSAGTPVYMKRSLQGIWPGQLIQEYPWEVRT